jgi:predicted ribosome quality control (RQC) complex YloA/Tae2 family protein
VHTSFLILSQLIQSLQKDLAQATIREIISWNSDELYFILDTPYGQVNLKLIHTSYLQLFLTINDVERPRSQVRPHFSSVHGMPIERVYVPKNDRSVVMEMMDNSYLVVKLYHHRVNVILVKNSLIQERLNPKLDKHAAFDMEVLNKSSEVEVILPNPLKYYIQNEENNVSLNISSSERTIHQTDNVQEALQIFQSAFYKYTYLNLRKIEAVKALDKLIQQHSGFVNKTRIQIEQLRMMPAPNQVADVIMANLHAWGKSITSAEVFDFYQNKKVTIEIKQGMTPQRYAEQLYQKSKNRHKQFDKLESLIQEREQEILRLQSEKEKVLSAENHKDIGRWDKEQKKRVDLKEQELPFKTTSHSGFQIWIGKNAANNELLTLKYTHKDDLWLHARDVSGSHVVIKHQAGKPFPKEVIERAAEIAAFYSQRKTDSLCPVSYTTKKYIRKVKGTAVGSVRMDREEVLMVVPKSE